MTTINIPPIVFQIVWPILYVSLLLFIIFTYQQFPSKQRTITIYLFWSGIFLNLLWILLFFQYRQIEWSIFVLIVMILIGFSILRINFIDKSSNKRDVTNFIIYTVYTMWLIFALFLLTVNTKN